MKNILKFKDLAIAFANNQKVTYYDDERELNQTCRIFALTEDTISIVNEEYQYDDLSFDKIINIIPKTTQQIIDEDFAGGLNMGQILPKQEISCSKEEEIDNLSKINDSLENQTYVNNKFEELFQQFKNK
jgi:hypothetical protein